MSIDWDVSNANLLLEKFSALSDAILAVEESETEEDAVGEIGLAVASLGFPNVMISLLCTEKGRQVIRAVDAFGEEWEAIKSETIREYPGSDILALVLERRKPRFVEDSRIDPETTKEAVSKSGIVTQYVIPLATRDMAIGTMQVHMEESGEKPELICKMLDALGAHLSIAISRFRSLVKLNEANDVILSQAKFAIANEVSGTLMHQLKTDIMAFREMVDGMMEDKRLRGHPAVFQVLQKLQKDARGWSAKVAAPLAFIVDTDDTVVCSAAETVAEAVTQWYDTADARGCRLKMFPCRSTIHVHIKPSHLKEVVSCLIVNALQAHARVIEVGIEREHPSPEQGAHAVLTVEDDGVGVPASVAQDMFRLGYTTKKKRGTGIGLFIVERLANAMSGQVWLAAGGRAQGKRRTVFKVSIPEDSGEQA